MRNFFTSETLEEKVSEFAAKLACCIRELHFKYRKLNTNSLAGLYRIGALGDKIHAFALSIGNQLVNTMEKEDKVVVNFDIKENDNVSEVRVGISPVSEYEWSDLFCGYDEMKGSGICFNFIFNGDFKHSYHWLYLEDAK